MAAMPSLYSKRTTIGIARGVTLFAILSIIVPLDVCGLSMLRVASWNLLAQDYVKAYKYPWTKRNPECVNWEHRKALIVDQLVDTEFKADIVCLQEAQVDLFEDLLSSLSPVYDGVIQNVTRGHNVAAAFLIRKSSNMRIKRIESRSRALIATLHDEENKKNLYICTVHLQADSILDAKNRERSQVGRLKQLKSVLRRINHFCKLEEEKIQEVPILVAGDFNMLRENPLHESLVEGSLAGSPAAHVTLNDAYLEAERHKRCSIPVYRNEGSLDDGTDEKATENDLYLVKTYRGGTILDYIWTSENLKVVDTLLYHPESSCGGSENWPCDDHPSDHVPIGIDVEWC